MSAPDKAQRYSDKRLKDQFTIYLMLSDTLQARFEEVMAAVKEDYPGIAWPSFLEAGQIDTASVTLGVAFGDKAEGMGMVSFSGMPGRLDTNLDHAIRMSRLTFPNAAAEVARHTSCFAINVQSVDDSLAARFDAARRVTLLGAVFAKLPICVGVYFPSADLIIPPDRWVKAADTAMKAELPILDWIALSVNPVPDGTAPTPITVQTMGAAAFIGHEVIMPLCRVPAPDAAFLVCAATEMLIQRGHVFRDSDTMGDDANRRMIRIRHWPEGKMGAQTDMWALLHPTFARSEDDLFGERALKPPPPGIDNSIRGDADSLKRKLYAFVAGLRR